MGRSGLLMWGRGWDCICRPTRQIPFWHPTLALLVGRVVIVKHKGFQLSWRAPFQRRGNCFLRISAYTNHELFYRANQDISFQLLKLHFQAGYLHIQRGIARNRSSLRDFGLDMMWYPAWTIWQGSPTHWRLLILWSKSRLTQNLSSAHSLASLTLDSNFAWLSFIIMSFGWSAGVLFIHALWRLANLLEREAVEAFQKHVFTFERFARLTDDLNHFINLNQLQKAQV